HYVLPGLEIFRGRRVLLLGGGDTAVDWALHLEPLASELTLIHRRDQFRAHEDSVKKLHASRCKVVPFHELRTLEGDGRIERAIIYDNRSNADTTMVVDDVVVNFGFVANLGPLKTWGLAIKGNSLEVSQKMETNLPGIFGAGDLVSYPGKLKLIATGFGEAAMAVCGAKMIVDPAAPYFPGHSSEMQEETPASACSAVGPALRMTLNLAPPPTYCPCMRRSFPREIGSIRAIAALVREFMTGERLGDDAAGDLDLVLEEAFTNLVKYGRGARGD